MKQILLIALSVIFLSVDNVTHAQDLEMSRIRLSAGPFYSVPFQLGTAAEVLILNPDTVTIYPTGMAYIELSVLGYELGDSIALPDSLLPGEGFAHNFGADNIIFFPDSNSSVVATAFFKYLGDSIAFNDTVTTVYTVNGVSDNDWTVASVEVISPEYLDNFDIDNGTNIPPALSEVMVKFVNLSEIEYVRNSPINYSIELGAESFNLTGYLTVGDILSGDTTTRTISNQAALPDLPDSVGTYDLCATIKMTQDLSNSNDQGCFTFHIVDNYDPNDPINWPQGIAEVSSGNYSIKSNGAVYQIDGIGTMAQLTITDMLGRQVINKYVSSNELLQAGFTSGLYTFTISENSHVAYIKVLVP